MDIAKLVFEIDSTQAQQAEKRLDSLAKASERVETSARKVRTATEQAGIGVGNASSATDRATKAAMAHAEAINRAERVMRGSLVTQTEATQLMLRNAQVQANMAKEAERAAASVQRLTSSYDPLAGEVLKVNRQLSEAQKLFAKGAISAEQYGAVTDGLKSKLSNLETAQNSGVKSSKALQFATLNMGRQFTDIGVQLAGGQNPFLVLTQQLPQIADGFAVAKQQGLGFTAVLRGMVATVAPFLPLLIGIGAVAGTVFGGAALAARALDKDNKNLTAGLGLTEKQMERLKDKGVDTGVTIGDVFKGTFNYIKGAVAPTLAPVIKWFNDLFDNITKGAVITVKAIVGGFAGAFAGIKTIWADLPAVMGDLFASGANLAISAIEKLLNFATAGINKLIEKANMVSGKVGGPQLGALGEFKLGRVNNANEGAASRTAANAVAAVADAYTKAGQGVDKVFAGIGAEIKKAASERIKKAAGDPEKARKTAEIRDMSDERSAQIAAQIEQALADELRARLSMAREISDRANIEREIARTTASAKQSRIDAQIAAIADDKGLSDLKKAELTLELNRLKFIEGGIADIQRQAISEKERADLAAEALATAQAVRQNEIDLLQSRQGLAQSAYESAKIEREIVEKRYQMERATLQATVDNATLKESERRIAQQRLETLEQIHANELKQLDKSASIVDAMSNAVRAIGDMARAFKSGDIGGGISALSNTLKQASGLLGSSSGLGGALGGIADFLGPIGGLVSGVSSLFGGLFGSSKKKKAARAQAAAQKAAEEAQRQQTIADTEFALQVQLLRAQGKELEATNMEREKEIARLAGISQASADMQKQLYALEDAQKAASAAAEQAAAIEAKRSSIQDEIDKLTLSSTELLAKTRAKERAEAVALDPTLGDLIDKLYAAQDATSATAAASAEQARIASYLTEQSNAAATAMQAQADAAKATADTLAGLVNKFVDLSTTLNKLADSLGLELGSSSGMGVYNAAKSRLLNGRPEDTADAVSAFLAASKSVASSQAAYNQDVLFAQAIARQKAGYATDIANGFGSLFSKLPGFASGGEFMVGGNAGVDQNLLSINGAPAAMVGQGEIVSVKKGGANDNSEIAALKDELSQMRVLLGSIANSSDKMERTLTNVTEGGRAMQTEAAS